MNDHEIQGVSDWKSTHLREKEHYPVRKSPQSTCHELQSVGKLSSPKITKTCNLNQRFLRAFREISRIIEKNKNAFLLFEMIRVISRKQPQKHWFQDFLAVFVQMNMQYLGRFGYKVRFYFLLQKMRYFFTSYSYITVIKYQ